MGCSAQQNDGAITLTYASPYSPMHPFSRADQVWMKYIEEQSHGTIKVRPFWAGSILSSEHSMPEIRHGVVDIGLITPIYARGGAHLIRAQAGFYAGMVTFDEQVMLYRCIAAQTPQFSEELHGLIVLAVQGGNLPGIVTRDRPVTKLDDLRGMRIRAPVELLGVLKELGVDPVDMPMGDVYPALAKGVLDGVVAPADALKSLHFAEVAHYFNTIHIPRGAYAARAISEKRWDTLTPAQQSLLRDSIAVWERALAEELLKADRAGAETARKQGMEFTTMPEADQDRFFAIYNRHAEQTARSLDRYGIDGLSTYQLARETAARIARGAAPCPGQPSLTHTLVRDSSHG